MSENENIKCFNKDFRKSNIHGKYHNCNVKYILTMGLETNYQIKK